MSNGGSAGFIRCCSKRLRPVRRSSAKADDTRRGDSALVWSSNPGSMRPSTSGRLRSHAPCGARRSPASVTSSKPTGRSLCSSIRCRHESSVTGRCSVRRSRSRTGFVAPIEVPVAYGGEMGPTSRRGARHRSRHVGGQPPSTRGDYRVFMLGFVPGFAYLGTVDESIAMPRRSTPRARVPAGSVAIAGRQTGIYPQESPGGWQIIGRTAFGRSIRSARRSF